MQWFHPLGGPVLLLPKALAPKWKGQHPEQGYTRFYQAVMAGLGDDPWVGLDIGGLALADQGPIGVDAIDGGLRFVVARKTPSPDRAAKAGSQAPVAPADKRIPWPGGAGLLFDAIENGATLDGGLTDPLELELPEGPLEVHLGTVDEDGVQITVVEVRRA